MSQLPTMTMASPALYGYAPMMTPYGASPGVSGFPGGLDIPAPIVGPAAAPASTPPASSSRPSPLATVTPGGVTQKKAIYFPDMNFQKERVLNMNARQRAQYALKHYTVDLAHAAAKGWRGDPDFSFSDFLLTSKIPYFAGGLALTSLFAMGGDRHAAARQGAGVAMYIAGAWAGNKIIDGVIKHRYGVDMNQKFLKYDGSIENVFTSPTFSRYDLIPKEELAVMQRKMGIPDYVIAPRQAIKGTIQDLIPAERTSRAILANVLAAVGAGYLARSLAWNRILGGFKAVPMALSAQANPNASFPRRLANAAQIAVSDLRAVAADKLFANAREVSPWLRRSVVGLLGFTALATLTRVLTIGQKKQWERPGDGFTPLSNEGSRRNTAFNYFREHQDARYVTALDGKGFRGGVS